MIQLNIVFSDHHFRRPPLISRFYSIFPLEQISTSVILDLVMTMLTVLIVMGLSPALAEMDLLEMDLLVQVRRSECIAMGTNTAFTQL